MTEILWRILFALTVLLPLPFGTFRPWAWSVAGVVVALLLLWWSVLVLLGRAQIFWRHSLWPPVLLFAGVVTWASVQTYWPTPGALAHPLWQMADQFLAADLTPRISAAPEAGEVALLRLLTGAGCFWLALQLGADRERAWTGIAWLGWASGTYALYGLLNLVAGNKWLLWYPRWAYMQDVTGTLVNRNSYATYAGLGLLAMVLLFIREFRYRLRTVDPGLSWLGRRVDALGGRSGVLLAASIIIAMALLQSHSRMGLFASFCGFGALLVLLRLRGIMRGWVASGIVAAAAAFVFLTSGHGTLNRLLQADGSDRPALIATIEQAIQSMPLIGSGFGSFEQVFLLYRGISLPNFVEYQMAHSTYLELAMELGIPAALALVACMAWLALTCLAGVFRRSRDEEVPAIAFAAALLVGLHSLLDFSMQIPAVGYTFAIMLGIGVAQAFPTIRVK